MHVRFVAAVISVMLMSTAASAAEDDARAAKIMWSAWLCATYAEMSGDVDEQRRLFNLGYTNGRRFVRAATAGTITAQEANSIVPMVVGLLMGGPTEEFVLGRLFEGAASQAFDEVVKHDADGMYLDLADWVSNDELKASIASNKYMRSNCEVIR